MLIGPQQHAMFLGAARRAQRSPAAGAIQPMQQTSSLNPPDVPDAPGLSSRMSPGTIPMKKGLR
jgi:hypothetical protein